ncbi:MAG: F0F1 ATP synthase subunit B' [Proteobacteria bacterium]|nr:F0F1 ATP synthase subunit B' [Pseudomonadota bacterium]
MPQLDPSTFPTQLFWLAVVFVVLLIVMARVGLPRVRAVIETRAAKIDGDLAAASDARGHSETLLAEYEKALAAARADAQATVRTMMDAIAKDQTQREHALMEQLTVEARSAEARIAAAKTAALANVRQIATETAEAATARLVGGPLPAAEVEAAVARVLAERRA